MWKFLVAAAVVCAGTAANIPEEDGVLVLGADNFDEAILNFKHIVKYSLQKLATTRLINFVFWYRKGIVLVSKSSFSVRLRWWSSMRLGVGIVGCGGPFFWPPKAYGEVIYYVYM